MHHFRGYFSRTFEVLKFKEKIRDVPGGVGIPLITASRHPVLTKTSHQVNWLDVPEHIKYKLSMMMLTVFQSLRLLQGNIFVLLPVISW